MALRILILLAYTVTLAVAVEHHVVVHEKYTKTVSLASFSSINTTLVDSYNTLSADGTACFGIAFPYTLNSTTELKGEYVSELCIKLNYMPYGYAQILSTVLSGSSNHYILTITTDWVEAASATGLLGSDFSDVFVYEMQKAIYGPPTSCSKPALTYAGVRSELLESLHVLNLTETNNGVVISYENIPVTDGDFKFYRISVCVPDDDDRVGGKRRLLQVVCTGCMFDTDGCVCLGNGNPPTNNCKTGCGGCDVGNIINVPKESSCSFFGFIGSFFGGGGCSTKTYKRCAQHCYPRPF